MARSYDHSGHHTPYQASTLVARAAALASLWLRRRQDRAELAWWSERDLHDAGTSRAALEYELRKPFWRQ